MANPLCKPIKTVLAKKYGFKNVIVKSGRGTSSGWVEIKVKIAKPRIGHQPECSYCPECRKFERFMCGQVREAAQEALSKENLKFNTYCSDDGYDSERDCVLIDVSLINS